MFTGDYSDVFKFQADLELVIPTPHQFLP